MLAWEVHTRQQWAGARYVPICTEGDVCVIQLQGAIIVCNCLVKLSRLVSCVASLLLALGFSLGRGLFFHLGVFTIFLCSLRLFVGTWFGLCSVLLQVTPDSWSTRELLLDMEDAEMLHLTLRCKISSPCLLCHA